MPDTCKTCGGSGVQTIHHDYGFSQDACPDHVDANKKVGPPYGYKTWLDYVISTMSFAVRATRPNAQRLARAELAELRARPRPLTKEEWEKYTGEQDDA